MINKIILTTIVTCLIGIYSTAFAATDSLSDVPQKHWAADAVKMLTSSDIISGYADGTFRGNRNITRYEASVLLARYVENRFSISSDKDASFSDIPENHWAYKSVRYIADAGIIKGYDNGGFRGNRFVTRYEMAQMLLGVLKLNADNVQSNTKLFLDVAANHWAHEAVSALSANGIITGYADKTFRGARPITRYETAMMIAKIAEYHDRHESRQ